ncbi:MAG: AraC family transcriptional regulator [Cyclobacteriaceae bacterium]
MPKRSEHKDTIKPGTSGMWWHDKNRGPIENLSFIKQFGHMKFTRINLDDNMKPHLNDGIEIHYIESGKYDWVIEDETVELYPDNLSITAPWHLNGSPSGKMDLGEINWLVLKPEYFSESEDLNLGKWTKLPKNFQKNLGEMIAEKGVIIRNARNFKRYFQDLKNELKNQEDGYEMMVVNIIENMLIALNRHLEDRKQQIQEEDSFIHTLIEHISTDLTKKWIVEDLAQHFGMGKTKFTDEVRRLTGYPPNSFLINLKLKKAKNLLVNHPNDSLSQIAYTCGFSSLQHFTSSFSQRTGITPAIFRKQHLAEMELTAS